MEKSAKVEDLKFKWGKKRGTGVEEKDVQYYESFTCHGSEYCLYDCVSVCNASKPDSPEFFFGKIIKMWEHNDHRQNPRRIELLWFFKPSEISAYLQEVQDVLANELFLASGTGIGLINENPVEAISGKCCVLCISKDARNPQPSDEEIKLANFLFRRTFDVSTCKISEKIDDQIAGVDVKFIFNRTSCEKKASAVQKVAHSLKPNLPSTSGSVRQYERNASDFSGHRKSYNGSKKEEDNECRKQLAREKTTFAEERSNKDSGRRDGELDYYNDSGSRRNDCHENKHQENEVRKQLTKQKSRIVEERSNKDSGRRDGELDYCNASGSRRNDCHENKHQENEVRKQLTEQKSRLAEERSNKVSGRRDGELDYCNASGSRRNDCHGNKHQENEVRKQLTKQKSRLAEERCSKYSYHLDDFPQKKRKQDGYVAVSEGSPTNLQKISHDSRNDRQPIRSPRDKVTVREAYSKKQDQRIPKFSEGKETITATENSLFKKPSSDCIISKRTEGKTLTDASYRRNYRVFEVTRKPDAQEESKWYRNLSWEENLKCAEGQRNLVLLQNLDPTYTSDEVENIVYSALNEQCTARMIEQTSTSIPLIGEALVIFKTMDAAKRVIRRLDEGCLLLSNGRTLVATNVKVNPPAKPPLRLFTGHIKPRAQVRRGMRDAVATSHSSQRNTIEFDMGLDWCLHRSIYELSLKRLFERQIEEMRKLKMNVKPKLA